MQHRAGRLDPRAGVVADVYALAHQGMAELVQVNSNLVLAAGLELLRRQLGAYALDVRETFSAEKQRAEELARALPVPGLDEGPRALPREPARQRPHR